MCVCVCVCECFKGVGACRGQERALDPLELTLHIMSSMYVAYWELNLGPLGKRQVLSTTEPSL